jgi:hypothetical protein
MTNSLEIPVRFDKKLKQDSKINFLIAETIWRFSPIIKQNNLEFFPEYTDHGFLHINKALEIANKIIPEETFEKINTLDIGTLILSIFFHDIGMHFTYDLFIGLISGKYKDDIDKTIDNKSWSTLWQEYLTEAKLWSAKKIRSLFNSNFEIKQPPKNRGEATENHRKFIGEFLRRYHHRISYETCIFGFPQINGGTLEFPHGLDYNFKKLTGLIARSHCMALWDVVRYIENEFGRDQIRTPYDIHAIYIMIVLRISDYLDIDRTRANTPILKFKKINSSISQLEWDKHNVVDHIKMEYQDDPESIYIYINKITESKIYLAIDELLNGMQKELDTCWAVLGKVYGNYENLKLKFRRVHSNMENKDIFLKDIKFIPERIKFDSNSDILKLLVEPLYGKNPAYGIRELLQNSVDACIEKEKILLNDYQPKVIITISEDEKYLIIQDNGIGMNKDTLINYFLVAGASFRNSDAWKKDYVENDKSTIPRSGKFGVGVFASFLLGDKIYVKTTKYNYKLKYTFNANIETDQIQVLKIKCDCKESGTEIKIKLYQYVIKELKKQYENFNLDDVNWYNWYFANKPKCIINTPKKWEKYENHNKLKVSLYEDNLEDYWRSIKPEGYYRVDWTYEELSSNSKFFYNGIAIQNNYDVYNLKRYRFPENFIKPIVSIVDNDGNLPLNLDRNGISDNKLPFETELVNDIYKDIIARLLTYKNMSKLDDNSLIIRDINLRHPAINTTYIFDIFSSDNFLLTKKGFNILHDYNIQKLHINHINKIWINGDTKKITDTELLSKIDQIVVSRENVSSIQGIKRSIDNYNPVNLGRSYDITNVRVFIKKRSYDYVFDPSKKRIGSGFKNSIIIEGKTDNWYCIVHGNVPKTKLSIEDFERNDEDINLFVEYYYKVVPDNIYDQYDNSNMFENMIKKYIDDEICIPYDINVRSEKYKIAFKELQNHIEKFRE